MCLFVFNCQVKSRARVKCVSVALGCSHWHGRSRERFEPGGPVPPEIFHHWISAKCFICSNWSYTLMDVVKHENKGEDFIAKFYTFISTFYSHTLCITLNSVFYSFVNKFVMLNIGLKLLWVLIRVTLCVIICCGSGKMLSMAINSILTPCTLQSNPSHSSKLSAFFASTGIPHETMPLWHIRSKGKSLSAVTQSWEQWAWYSTEAGRLDITT